MNTSKDELKSSSCSRRYDVFPSFRGEDVRKGFLSHLLKALEGRSINTFIDNGIERSRLIAQELLKAIEESSISIVVFSKNYASSTWCLNELVKIHECCKELGQMVIPVFYDVDPSDVRKQTGDFGKVFEGTCKDKTEDEKQRWVQALADVASIAGEDLLTGSSEADVVEKIANDVSNKLMSTPNSFGEFVGIEAHLEALMSILCIESKEAKMIGIWGTSGIGKSTIGRALYSQLSHRFPLRNFVTYKQSTYQDVSGMKSSWEQEFLSEILGQRDIQIEHFGVVKRRLKDKKVLIVLDDVDSLEFLKTLVGKTEWFGSGSRIIVITQDRQLLKAHNIDLLYEVKFPSEDLALKMLCRSAFDQDSPPDDFKKLAVKVVALAGNLPLGLNVLGSSLKGREKNEWIEMLPRLEDGLNGGIMKVLRVSYNKLDEEDKELFHYIASLFNGQTVEYFNDLLGDFVGLNKLAEKSLIRITQADRPPISEMHGLLEKLVKEIDQGGAMGSPVRHRQGKIVEVHRLLEKLATEIDREESKGNPGRRRFLKTNEEIEDVLTDQTGTEYVLGIYFNAVPWVNYADRFNKSFILINENSFKGMQNLEFLKIGSFWNLTRWCLPNGLLDYLPRKLKLIHWRFCPLKCFPSNFKAAFLVELIMYSCNLEKLWEGTQLLGSLKKIILCDSEYLKEIPDLSTAINLKTVDIHNCKELESFPTPLNSKYLEYLDLQECPQLKNFPMILMERSLSGEVRICVYDCLWNKNLPGLDYFDCFRRCNPSKFRPEHLVSLEVKGNMLEKLWEGVQSLGSLKRLDLSKCGNLTEIPDLSKATILKELTLSKCKSLVVVPSTIGNLQQLCELQMNECTRLEVLPVDVNLPSLRILSLRGCSSLTSFPQISRSIVILDLGDTAIEQVPCCVEILPKLNKLDMHGCRKLKNINPSIFSQTSLKQVDFTDCGGVITALGDIVYDRAQWKIPLGGILEQVLWADKEYFNFQNCFKLDEDVRRFILESCVTSIMVLPGEKVPTYFEHQAYGNSLTVTLPQSSLSQDILRFKACVVVESLNLSDLLMSVHIHFNGKNYMHKVSNDIPLMCNTDHLVLFYFKFYRKDRPFKLDFNDVEFNFSYTKKIKECGIRLLNVSPLLDDSDGSSETECNQQSGEKCDVVEAKRSKKRMKTAIKKTLDARIPFADWIFYDQQEVRARMDHAHSRLGYQSNISLQRGLPSQGHYGVIPDRQEQEVRARMDHAHSRLDYQSNISLQRGLPSQGIYSFILPGSKCLPGGGDK